MAFMIISISFLSSSQLLNPLPSSPFLTHTLLILLLVQRVLSESFSLQILRNLVEADANADIKRLPEGPPVSLPVRMGNDLRLIFHMEHRGSLTLSLTPCNGVLSWKLLWFPLSCNASQGEPNDIEGNWGYSCNNKGSPIDFLRPFNDVKKHIKEKMLDQGEGMKPWDFHKEKAFTGIYVIKIRSLSRTSIVHAMASTKFKKRNKPTFVKTNAKKKGNFITLKWNSDPHSLSNLFCLVVSETPSPHSLCAARHIQKIYRSKKHFSEPPFVLGCTKHPHYTLPVTPNTKYYVRVWQPSSLLPLAVKSFRSKPHRRIAHLRPGTMEQFTLASGGKVRAQFRIRPRARRLHVAAVSCPGGINVEILARRKRVASASGKEALHLTVRRPPSRKVMVQVSPDDPFSHLYRVQLAAAYSAKKLPIPRLPRNVSVNTTPINCTCASVHWSAAPGGVSYCVLARRHPSGRLPEMRPPFQCGWEQVIQRPDLFDATACFNGSSSINQETTLCSLTPGGAYLSNVLIRHPKTGRTLALKPAMIRTPFCL